MATFDARNARKAFDATDLLAVDLAGPVGHVSHSATTYVYNSRGGDRITLTGFGITTAANNMPTAGTITSVGIDLDRNGSIDATVSRVSAPITSLTSGPESFWLTLLKGNDVIYAPRTQAAVLFGDAFETFLPTKLIGGNDSFVGGSSLGQTFYGDVVHVGSQNLEGDGHLTGGDDTVVANNRRSTFIYGDALDCQGITLGGDDRLTGSDIAGDTIVGDVGRQQSGYTIGGNDTIGGRGGNDTLIGDVQRVEHFPGGTDTSEAVGGDDLIRGGTGNDTIYGDFYFVSALDVGANNFGSGSDDTLYGDAGMDVIIGDLTMGHEGIGIYGADKIYGGVDDDTIYGDYQTDQSGAEQVLTDDELFAYHDEAKDDIDCGTGNDIANGGFGNDRLIGNLGNDTLNGDTGSDLVIGSAGADVINGGINADRLYGDQGAPASPDRFIFDLRAGNDRTFDFQDDVDQIEIASAYGFANASDVVATATVNGNDVTLHLSSTDSITLIGYGNAPNTLMNDILIV